jgi:phosphatidylinositol alpha-1,6-mannosyltransferase
VVRHWHSLEVLVLTGTPGATTAIQGDLPYVVRRPVSPIRLDRRRQLVWLNAQALAQALRFRPDVVLSAHIAMAPAAWAISRLHGTPYVQYLYGAELIHRPRLARFAARHAAAVIAISQYTAALAHQWVSDGVVHQISPGVDLPPASPRGHSAQPVVITVARLTDWYKGHDVMLRALPLVRARVPEVEWVVVGDGQLRASYERMASAFGLSSQVRFVGNVEDIERDRLLDGARVFAMPSRLSATGGGEGFGIVYLEAGAHRLPVLAGNVAGARDAVIDGVTGVLVDPTDHLAVAEALSGLLLDRFRAESLGCAGETRAQSLGWPKVSQRVESLLHQVVLRAA